jgi:hypothetical protein
MLPLLRPLSSALVFEAVTVSLELLPSLLLLLLLSSRHVYISTCMNFLRISCA